MQCVSCKTDISPAFKHAIVSNVCPACGNSIMDEESLALIEHMKSTILSEVKLRDETVHKLVLILLANYNITFQEEISQKSSIVVQDSPKTPISDTTQKFAEQQRILKLEDIESMATINREEIMEEAVRERYAMVDQAHLAATDFDNEVIEPSGSSNSLFQEGEVNPILEQERLMRLAKQKQALATGGKNSFRRSE